MKEEKLISIISRLIADEVEAIEQYTKAINELSAHVDKQITEILQTIKEDEIGHTSQLTGVILNAKEEQ